MVYTYECKKAKQEKTKHFSGKSLTAISEENLPPDEEKVLSWTI
jgi:hypothetical protein